MHSGSQIRAYWASSLILGVSAGCYDGAFLDLACDRQGTCPASSSSSTTEPGTSDRTTSATGDTTTSGPEPGLHAFRITELILADPRFYFTVAEACTDVTDILQPALSDEISKGGLNLVMLFDDLDPSADAVRGQFTEAACVVGTGKTSCSFKPGDVFAPTDISNALDAPCPVIWPGTANLNYMPQPNEPGPVCFATERRDFVLPMLGTLPALFLREASISARYATSAPVNNLVEGALSGYLTAAEAAAINSQITGIPFNLWATIAGSETSCMPAEIIDDTDPDPDPNVSTRGVWFYLNFTATRVEWID